MSADRYARVTIRLIRPDEAFDYSAWALWLANCDDDQICMALRKLVQGADRIEVGDCTLLVVGRAQA